MKKLNTHFEQVSIETIKGLAQDEIHEDENAERPEQTKERDVNTSLKAKG